MRLTGAKLGTPVMAPDAPAAMEGSRKSMKPSMTRKLHRFRQGPFSRKSREVAHGADGSLLGYLARNSGEVTRSAMRVSLPTAPHLCVRLLTRALRHSDLASTVTTKQTIVQYPRKLDAAGVRSGLCDILHEVARHVDTTSDAREVVQHAAASQVCVS